MRISAKPGQPATIKLDKRESDLLDKSSALLETIAQHCNVPAAKEASALIGKVQTYVRGTTE